MDRIHGRDIDMTADELRIKVRDALKDAWNNDEDETDAVIRVVLLEAAAIADSYEPQCDTCPRGVFNAILNLLPQDKQKDAA